MAREHRGLFCSANMCSANMREHMFTNFREHPRMQYCCTRTLRTLRTCANIANMVANICSANMCSRTCQITDFVSAIYTHWHMFRHTSGGGSEIQFGRGEWMERHGGAKQWKLTCHTTYQRTWREHAANTKWCGTPHGWSSRASPHCVVVRSTVTQSEPIKSWNLKGLAHFHCCSLDSFTIWTTHKLETQAPDQVALLVAWQFHKFSYKNTQSLSKTPTDDDLQKTTSREHMFSANMREHMFREHVFANTRTQRTYVHEPSKIYIYIYI